MLTLLKIRNLALVDELVWELGEGLVAVTGETGAGKSVIVGALKLVLGERADKSLIRTGEESCTVEAVFDLDDASEIDAVLEEGGLDVCDGGLLIVRRVIGTKVNRQFARVDGLGRVTLSHRDQLCCRFEIIRISLDKPL